MEEFQYFESITYVFFKSTTDQLISTSFLNFSLVVLRLILAAELKEYQTYLRSQLAQVEEALDVQAHANKKSKRFVPISASLPNTESNYFLDRIGSLMINYQPLDENSTMDYDVSNSTSAEIINLNATEKNHTKVYGALTFNPTRNHTAEECKQLTKAELIRELKRRGTYNPDLMAWDASGVFRFLDRSIVDQYEVSNSGENYGEFRF